MTAEPFLLSLPEVRTSGVVFASPHSGRRYPWPFLRQSMLDERSIRSSEDAFVDRLFSSAPQLGAPLLSATLPRAYVDLNRGSDELDPGVIEGVRTVTHNPRVSSGLGVIPRVVANGRAIYRGKLPMAEARSRLADVWRPYHAALQNLLDESKEQFGAALLVDCHSMPHEAIEASGSGVGKRPEIVLGDRFGAACGPDLIDRVESAFVAAGFRVARNAPFAGAYITQHYGRPSRRQHCVQVEIDRALYMDETKITPHAGFTEFQHRLQGVIGEVADILRPAKNLPLAAE